MPSFWSHRHPSTQQMMIFTVTICLSVMLSNCSAFVVVPNRHYNPSGARPQRPPETSAARRHGVGGGGTVVVLFAKKKSKKKKQGGGGGGKQQQQRQSGFEWASSFQLKPFESQETRDLTNSALSSYKGRVGRYLLADESTSTDVPKSLWEAPIACLIVAAAGPPPPRPTDKDDASTAAAAIVVTYANAAALETVGLAPDEFGRLLTGSDGTPPTGSVVTVRLPNTLHGDDKYQNGYEKKLLRAGDNNGNDVTVLRAQRWAVEKTTFIDGQFVSETSGVAYTWATWLIAGTSDGEDDFECSPGGVRKKYVPVVNVKDAIEEQAAVIRELKEGQGLTNKDPLVVDAVEELLRLKAILPAE